MINVLDLDESSLLSEFKLEDWSKEFEVKFNAPLIEAQRVQQQAQQNQMMGVQDGQRITTTEETRR